MRRLESDTVVATETPRESRALGPVNTMEAAVSIVLTGPKLWQKTSSMLFRKCTRVWNPFAIATLQPGQGDFVVIATQHKGDHESMQRGLYRADRQSAKRSPPGARLPQAGRFR